MGQGHAVALGGEQIRGEQRDHLEVRGPVERGPRREPGREARPQVGQRIGRREGRAQVARVKLFDPRRELKARQVREQRIVGRAGVEEEALPEVAATSPGIEVRIQPLEQPRS